MAGKPNEKEKEKPNHAWSFFWLIAAILTAGAAGALLAAAFKSGDKEQ